MVPASLGLCMGPCLRVWGSSPVRLAAAAAVVPERARPLEVELGVAEEGAVEQRQQPKWSKAGKWATLETAGSSTRGIGYQAWPEEAQEPSWGTLTLR